MSLMTVSNLTVRRRNTTALNGVSATVGAGECVGLLGPNGSGKTTLMRAALGLIAAEGESDLARLPPAERALRVAWLPQSREIAWPVAVQHIVALGARARRRAPDHPTVAHALERLGLASLKHRPATALSGGEQARVLMARALAQDTPLLMVDEPLAGLGPAQAIRTMRLLHRLAAEDRGVLASLHDLGLASRFCTRVMVMDAGRLVADGPPGEILTDRLLAEVFGITCSRIDAEEGTLLLPIDTVAR